MNPTEALKRSERGRWPIVIAVVFGIATLVSIVEMISSAVHAPISLDFVLMRLGGILQLAGLAFGVWVLNSWGRFLLWALIAWSLFGMGMTMMPPRWDLAIFAFALVQALCVGFLYLRQKQAVRP